MRRGSRHAMLCAVADAGAVLVFVAVGRRSHDEGSAVTGTLEVAGPFLIAAALGWAIARAWRRPAEPGVGLVVWLVTVAAGMVLRRTLFDRGTEPSFVVVATIVLGVLVIGWRVALRAALGRRHRTSAAAPTVEGHI